MKNTFFALLLLLTVMGSPCLAQLPEPGFETTDLFRIAERYRRFENLSFQVHYHFADSAQPHVLLEQHDMQYQLKNGRYTAKTDSMEIIGGDRYTIQVFFDEKLMVLSHSQGHSDLLQLPVNDSLFMQANVDSIKVYALSDSTNRMDIRFGAASPYSKYQLFYNNNSYLVDSIRYYVREPASDDIGASPTSVITAEFSNYSYAVIDEACFDIHKYVFFEEIWKTKPAYPGYTLVDPEGRQTIPDQ